MKRLMVFSILIASSLAYPGLLYHLQPGELPYVRFLAGAPIGPDGRVVDTPAVAAAKAQHEVAQINQRIKLANEAAKSADPVAAAAVDPASIIAANVPASIPVPGGAPLGPDGQVVDTPEVTKAKADHAAAQINERVKLAQENIRSNSQPIAVILPNANLLPRPVPIIPQIIYPIF